jgi:chloramphenicol-sensitive protein RarD
MRPAGIFQALLAYGAWGVLPVYWKALASVSATEVLANRIVWTVLFGAVLLAMLRRTDEVRDALSIPRERFLLACSGVLIGANWLLYIWAVNHDRLLEASLGYYLNPLFSVLLGVLFLGERLRPWQALAVAIAAAGVAVLVVDAGGVPWIALGLAVSFGLYGLAHKLCPVRPIPGLAIETAVLAPAALLWLFVAAEPAGGVLRAGPDLSRALLVGAGPATALPLLWFAGAARHLRLATLGLFQYLAPSIGFVLAIFVYDEPFTRGHAIAFAGIWSALALYSVDAWRAGQEVRVN